MNRLLKLLKGTEDRTPTLPPPTGRSLADENYTPPLPNEDRYGRKQGCEVVETANHEDYVRFASEIIGDLIDRLPADASDGDSRRIIDESFISPVADATLLLDDNYRDAESSFNSGTDCRRYIEKFVVEEDLPLAVCDTDSEFESADEFAVNLSSDIDGNATTAPTDVNSDRRLRPNFEGIQTISCDLDTSTSRSPKVTASSVKNSDVGDRGNLQSGNGAVVISGAHLVDDSDPSAVDLVTRGPFPGYTLTDGVDIDLLRESTPTKVSDVAREEVILREKSRPLNEQACDGKRLVRFEENDDAIVLADSLLDFEREELNSQYRTFTGDEVPSQSEIDPKSNAMPTAESSETDGCSTTADSTVLDFDPFEGRSRLADSPPPVPTQPPEGHAICLGATVVDVESICASESNDDVKNGADAIVRRTGSPISADMDDGRAAQQCLMESSVSEDSGIDVPQASKDVHSNVTHGTDSRDVANFSEAGPDVANVGNCGDVDEFRPAADFFLDPNGLDFLEKCDSGKFTQSVLSRMSLYTKFDPLVPGSGNVPSPVSRRLTMWLKQQQESAVGDAKPTVKSQVDNPPNAAADDTLKFEGPQKLIDLEASLNLENRSEEDDSSSPKSKCDVADEKRRSGGGGRQIALSSSGDDEVRHMMKIQEILFQDRQLIKDREWDERLRSLEAEKQQLAEQVQSLRDSQHQMRQIVTEYEKTISELISDKEGDKRTMTESVARITRERDQALEDLQSVENAFADLHRRYEKAKVTVEGFKKNEDTLKGCVTTFQAKLNRQVDMYEQLRNCAEDRLESANQEIENLKKTNEAELAALRAQLKKAEMKVESLEKSLEQKVKENSELTNICDELIARVGQNA